jgi:predicted secreted hydrolase
MSAMRIMGVLILILAGGSGCAPQTPNDGRGTQAGQSVAEALGAEGDAQGYARAFATRRFVFPADHGAHPDFRNEWWYFTGNLATPEGRRFGYQLTLFRIALVPERIPSTSAWRSRQVYMGHFALSDLDRGGFHAFERFARGGGLVAGARNPPLQVWLDHWSVSAEQESGFPLRLQAAQEGVAIDLTLTPHKPPVLNGEAGLSRKSDEPGNASYYYSMTRLHSVGSVTIGGATHPVSGSSWLDREWSTSALAEDQEGWDWFAIQLDDGRDLMLYRLRRKDGSIDPASAGTLVLADGGAVHLDHDDLELQVLEHWTSPDTGVRYPARWRLRVPGQGIELLVEPLLANQELNVTVRYWEGAVQVTGSRGLSGQGYMELAGYGS